MKLRLELSTTFCVYHRVNLRYIDCVYQQWNDKWTLFWSGSLFEDKMNEKLVDRLWKDSEDKIKKVVGVLVFDIVCTNHALSVFIENWKIINLLVCYVVPL